MSKAVDEKNDGEDNVKANIMIAGKTGVGKSTLLNAIFGFDDNDGAETGFGRPITKHIQVYEKPDVPVRIWDTVGLEINSEKTRESIESIKQVIADRAEKNDELDQIHAIWYCINSGSRRYEGAELDFIKDLHDTGVPFTIVLTQCYGSKKNISEFADYITEENNKKGMDDISVEKVLAADYEIELDDGNVQIKHASGLDELVLKTAERIPDYAKVSFIAAQKVNMSLKHIECEKEIWRNVYYVRDSIVYDIPLVNLITTDWRIRENLLKYVTNIYDTEITDDEINRVTKECQGLDPKNAAEGLLAPSTKRFDKNVDKFYNKNKSGKYDWDYKRLPKTKRASRMIVLYGYTFLQAIEQYWDELIKSKARGIDAKIGILIEILKGLFHEY